MAVVDHIRAFQDAVLDATKAERVTAQNKLGFLVAASAAMSVLAFVTRPREKQEIGYTTEQEYLELMMHFHPREFAYAQATGQAPDIPEPRLVQGNDGRNYAVVSTNVQKGGGFVHDVSKGLAVLGWGATGITLLQNHQHLGNVYKNVITDLETVAPGSAPAGMSAGEFAAANRRVVSRFGGDISATLGAMHHARGEAVTKGFARLTDIIPKLSVGRAIGLDF